MASKLMTLLLTYSILYPPHVQPNTTSILTFVRFLVSQLFRNLRLHSYKHTEYRRIPHKMKMRTQNKIKLQGIGPTHMSLRT